MSGQLSAETRAKVIGAAKALDYRPNDLAQSPHRARSTMYRGEMAQRSYSPLPFAEVAMTGPFWRERLDTVLSRTIPSQHAKLGEAGILGSLKLPKPVPPLRIPLNSHDFTMQVFWDFDVGKWIEAASYALSHRRDAVVEARIDAIVDDLAKAQSSDGYLNCWYNGREPEKRWTNLRDNHELYNAGHLLEGAIAYFRATGRRRFLDLMERYLDHIAATFGAVPATSAATTAIPRSSWRW